MAAETTLEPLHFLREEKPEHKLGTENNELRKKRRGTENSGSRKKIRVGSETGTTGWLRKPKLRSENEKNARREQSNVAQKQLRRQHRVRQQRRQHGPRRQSNKFPLRRNATDRTG